jgi:radical SAM protein with 4Fe4S-binding SPASM domain
MQEEVWGGVIEAARQVTAVVVTGYGEPTNNPRFFRMLSDLDRLDVAIIFSTNGTNVGRDFVKQLAGLKNLAHVSVSVDSPDPDVFRAIRGGDVNRALQGVRFLAEGLPAGVVLAVSSVVMQCNLASLVAFPPILAEIGVKQFILQPLNGIGPAYENDHLYNRNSDPKYLEAIRASCEALGIELVNSYEDRMHLEMTDSAESRLLYHDTGQFSKTRTRQCVLPWTVPFVDKDGNVHPCFNGDYTSVMGNIRETPFGKIWEGNRFETFRTELLSGCSLPSICRKCNVAPLGQHPLNAYAARLRLERSHLRGERLKLVVENIGEEVWTRRARVELRTFGNRPARAYHQDWISPHRVCSTAEEEVAPAGTGTFLFRAVPTSVTERLQLFVWKTGSADEDGFWLPNTQIAIRPSRSLFRRWWSRT